MVASILVEGEWAVAVPAGGGGYDHPQVAVRASNEEANMSWT